MLEPQSEWNCPEVDELANQIGEFIQYWGFKRVHGRIWAILYLSREPLDATQIRQRLKISKALVSLSVRDLLHYKVIQEVGKSERGTILYRANPNIKEPINMVLNEREKKLISLICTAQEKCSALNGELSHGIRLDFDHLQSLGELALSVHQALDRVVNAERFDGEVVSSFLGVANKNSHPF